MSYTNFRIFHDNFIDLDILANYYKSSEKTTYPASNAFNQQRRSKVWRTDGYWDITSSNNKIIFRETTGVDLTATLAVAQYTSTTSLMAEIKQALEISGGSTYTVTQDNLRFKIVSNGVGGGGIFELETTGTTCDLLGLVTDKTGSLTHTMDNIIIHDEEYIVFDMGVPSNPDAFILTDQRNSTIKISPSATIKLEGNETFNWTSPTFTKTLTYDDNIISHISDAGIHTGPLRYWRFYCKDRTNPQGYIQIGAMFLGNYMNHSRGRAQFPFNTNYDDFSSQITSEGGQIYTDIKSKSAKYSVNFKALQKADIETFDTFFADYGLGKPFFVSMDSGTVFSSNINRRIILCYFDKEPSWTLESPDNFTLNMQLKEAL